MTRLINYEGKKIGNTNIWMCNKEDEMSRNDFRKLKKQYKSDLKMMLKQTVLNFTKIKSKIDIQMFLLVKLLSEFLNFRNRLDLNQCVQILEIMMTHLTPINQKVFFVECISKFDFIDDETHERLDRIKDKLIKSADYTDMQFYDRCDLFLAFVDPPESVEKDRTSDRVKVVETYWTDLQKQDFPRYHKTKTHTVDDIKTIDDGEDYVTAYRGFVVQDDDRIRTLDAYRQDNIDDQLADDEKSVLKQSQFSGDGVSYTLDKQVAHFFAFYSEKMLREHLPEKTKLRAVVGKYHITKSDIFSYSNGRNEREVVLKSNKRRYINKNGCLPVLCHYEFFTSTKGDFDKTGGIENDSSMRPSIAPHQSYAPDRKIMRVFN